MVNKILGKMEATKGFIQIPAKNRDELIGDLVTPFKTFVNNEPARIDNYHRLWSPKLKGKFVDGARIIIKKTENGYFVEPHLCSSEHKSNKEDLSNSKSDTKLTLQAAKISIGYKRTCKCPPSHINCMTAKDWIQSQVAVWEFFYEKRDIRDKNIHPAMFPIALPMKCIRLFTHEGELVLDPFVGSGTTLLAAQDLNRNAVGFDLKKEYIELARSRLTQTRLSGGTQQIAIQDDAHNIPQYLESETVSLCVTSPPYANMLNRRRLNKSIRGNLRQNEHYLKIQQYSNDPRDLGTMNSIQYAKTLEEIYRGILPLMRPKAHCVINVTDLWWENKRVPVHVHVIEALQRAGFELRNIIIWDRRNLVNRVGIFGWPSNYITLGTTFEYILDFWRPPK
jgi:DNA modification methylase